MTIRTFFLILPLIFFSPAAFSTTYGIMCQDCSPNEMNACAYDLALQQNLGSGDEIWVLDANTINSARFLVQGVLPGDPLNTRPEFNKGDSKSFDSLTQWPFGAEDQQMLDGALIFIRDLVLDNGGEIYVECSQSKLITKAPKNNTTPVIEPIIIPPDLFGSAYDLIGNQAAGIRLGNWISDNYVATSFLSNMLTFADRLFNLPVNSTVILRVEFADGSVGIWSINAAMGQWEADFDSFRDSDGNPIPVTDSDLAVGLAFEFSFEAPGEDNLERFLQRARSFGIPITSPGGSGPPGSGRTYMVCGVNSAGEFRCVVRRTRE